MIPAVAHFIWLGRAFPWAHVLALRSAATRGGFERVVLHHTDDLGESPFWRAALEVPGIETRRVDPERLLASAPHGDRLVEAYGVVDRHASRANVLRAAILAREGGVYLDMDTVTVGSFAPLLAEHGALCGEERIALPARLLRSRDPLAWVGAGARLAARDLCRRLPRGHRAFRRIEGAYPRAVNNAVLGAEPGHPFVVDLLRRMAEVPPERAARRYALGTHLLQEAVAAFSGPGLSVQPPPVFYPLGPEVSEHWFRRRRSVSLAEFLRPETRLVHWYASVRTEPVVPCLTPEHVRRHASTEAFSALARPFL